MSKGSKQRPTDTEKFNAQFDVIFVKNNLLRGKSPMEANVFNGCDIKKGATKETQPDLTP